MSGISQMFADIAAKRLQLLQKTIPTLSHVALSVTPQMPVRTLELSQYSSAARELGLSYDVFDVSTANDIDQAFQRMAEQHLQAVVVFSANFFPRKESEYPSWG